MRKQQMRTMAATILVAAEFFLVAFAQAATPSSGTLTTTSPLLTYTGGPFDNTNTTGVPPIDPAPGVTPVCLGTTSPCDDFELAVTVPSSSSAAYSLYIQIDFANPTGDFDLYVMDPDGTTVVAGSGNTAGNPESVTIQLTPGTTEFIVRVIPYDVTTGSSGDTYTATLLLSQSALLDPPDPPELPTAAGVPRFKNYHAPDGQGDSAGEPSLGVNWATGKVMFAASLDTLRIGFDDCSSPATDTWELKSAPTSVESLDPILFTDSMTNRTFVSQLTGACSLTSYTDDDGETYTPTEGCGTPAGADHQSIGGGPFAPGTLGPTTSYPNAVYYCSQSNVTSFCAMSQNGGLTFGPGVAAWNSTQCAAFHGHIEVAPDGTVYVPNKSCTGTGGMIVSQDNGLTWTVRKVTGSTASKNGALVDPSIGIGAQGRVYFGYQRDDGHAWIAVSDDRGLTWNHNQDVGLALGIENMTFPEVAAGDNDRAAFAFLGTTTAGDYGDNIGFNAVWHLYVATTYDGGATWTTVDATPHDPVQRGSICNQGTVTCMHVPDDRNLLDFNDIAIDKRGRILVAYADGCITPGCVHGSASGHTLNDFTSKAAIARQSGGRGLLAQYDPGPAEPVRPGAPRLFATRTAPGVVNLSWESPDNGGAPITGYKVYRGTVSGSETFLNSTGAKNAYEDITVDPALGYWYRITASNAVGEGAFCGEVFVDPVVVPGTDPCAGPGTRVSTDASDGAPNVPASPAVDIRYLSVSEPYFSDGSHKLVFTLQVGESTLPTPSSQWYIMWNRPIPDASFDRDYVAMKTDASGVPSFEYGKISPPNVNLPTGLGPADGGSYDSATGTIRITIANSLVDGIAAGQTLTAMQGRTFLGRPNGLPVSQNSTSDYSPEGLYMLVGNAACRVNNAPIATLTTNPFEGCVGSSFLLDGSPSSDPDAGDTIGTYHFSFGDGNPDVVQSAPTVSHAYASAGDYGARLHVTDSRGKISQNVDIKTISVVAAPVAAAAGSGTVCAGASTTLMGSGGTSCSWTPSTGLSDAASCSPTVTPTQTTGYTLTVASAQGCASSNPSSVTVTVAPCAISEVEGLRWDAGVKSTLHWISMPNATSYRLVRGVGADLPGLLGASVDSCVRFEGTGTTTGPVLSELPEDGMYWYLVDALNGSNVGPGGSATAGPRIVNPSGTCP